MSDAEQEKRKDVSYAVEVARAYGPRPSTTPWLAPALAPDPPLELATVLKMGTHEPSTVTVGIVDEPSRQRQSPVTIDLTDGIGQFYGGIGSGKTTALVTSAAAFTHSNPESLIIAMDATGDLIAALAGIGIAGQGVSIADTARLTMTIERVEALVRERVGGESATPPLLLLVDGADAMRAAVTGGRDSDWMTRLRQALSTGRRYGIHGVIAAANPTEVPSDWRALGKAVFTLGESTVGGRAPVSRPPGIGTDRVGNVMQVAVATPLGSRPTPSSLWSRFSELVRPAIRTTERLRAEGDSLYVPIGLNPVDGSTVTIELGWRHLLVVGPPRSGKSNLLALVATAYTAALGEPGGILFARRPLPVDRSVLVPIAPAQIHEAGQVLASTETAVQRQFVERALEGAGLGHLPRPLIVVDDAHAVARDKEAKRWLQLLVEQDRANVVIAADVGTVNHYEWRELKEHSSQVVFLRPTRTTDNDDGSRVLGDVLRIRRGYSYLEGDGVVYDRGAQREIQSYLMEGE